MNDAPAIVIRLRLEHSPDLTVLADDEQALARLDDWLQSERFANHLRSLIELFIGGTR